MDLSSDPSVLCNAKQRIAFNFSRAASTYDEAATLQKQVAASLLKELPEDEFIGSILDLGAGTGCHSQVLSQRYTRARVTGMDLAMGMLKFAQHRSKHLPSLQWCSGDIEALPFRDGSFDLVFSSLAIQWCQLKTVLQEAYRVLTPGGQFVFSTLAGGSLVELDLAWQAVAETNRVNQFDSFESQSLSVKNSTFDALSFDQRAETLFYSDVVSLLKELKALGVNTVLSGHQGLMTRNKLQGLQVAYEIRRAEQGLPLTYQVIYGVLQKPKR